MSAKHVYRTIDRELSWLSFNERVLQEATDPGVPLGERLNFLAIIVVPACSSLSPLFLCIRALCRI
jgi:polyphosphate kinase